MKSFKRNMLAAGVALAASTAAFGAIDSGVVSGNGELFLTVYDTRDVTVGGDRSYTRDLGTFINDWVSESGAISGAKTTAGFRQTFASDAVWNTFIAGMSAADVAGLSWDIYGMDITGTGTNQKRFVTTTNGTFDTPSSRPTNSNINGGIGSVSNYIDANNNLIPAPGNVDFAANISVIAGSGDGVANANNGKRNNLLGAFPQPTTTNVGGELNFWYLTMNGTSGIGRANMDLFDTTAGDAAKWSFAADGTLTYVAAVPEAETWAMFVAGLLGVGAIARRRLAV